VTLTCWYTLTNDSKRLNCSSLSENCCASCFAAGVAGPSAAARQTSVEFRKGTARALKMASACEAERFDGAPRVARRNPAQEGVGSCVALTK
jgi:hypothetical protein